MKFKRFKASIVRYTDTPLPFNGPVTPWHSVPPVDGGPPFNGPVTPRPSAPSTPWFGVSPTDKVEQVEQYALPSGSTTDRASPFKPPLTSKVQLANIDPRIRQQVARYAEWLARQANYDMLNDNTQEINDYIQNATKVVKVGGKEVATFAPFRPELSALQTFTTKQSIALCAIGVLWVIGLIVFRLEMLTAVIAAITLLYFSNLILNVFMAIRSFRQSPEEQIDDAIVHALKDADWPLYTILCPLYREAQVVPQFVKAMQELDYPAEKLQVLFLTEVDDVETRNTIRALSLPSHFKIVTVPDGKPRTKPRACNYGLMQAKGPYVVIYDAEDIPDPLQLKKAVLAFANHGTEVVCVQAKLNFYNIPQNLLTRWFTAEYSVWFDLILPGLQQADFSLPLGGTSNHFRTAALRALGGWDAYNVTEDCDLGLRLARYHLKTVVLDSTTYEEANSQLKNWLRQRSRWIKGYMQTYLVHMRHPLEYFKKGRLYNLFSFQAIVGSGTGVLFLNPLMWVLLAIYIAFRPIVSDLYHVLFPTPILYMGLLCLIFGNFFYLYLYLLGCVKRKEYRLIAWTLFIPFYWGLISLAGAMALFELLVKPHYWQKTVHGLHLKKEYALPEANVQQMVPALAEEQTMPIPAMNDKTVASGAVPSVTMSLKAIATTLMPAFSRSQKHARRESKHYKVRDLWFTATVFIACVASIAACIYFFQQHQILLYGDAKSHLMIARRFFDNATPFDVTQFGGVWLPLPHILMLPFIWNDYLWRTGLAGSFVSMFCYVVTVIYLYLAARRLTQDSRASFIGVLLFILNPNILYLQTTPLSELVCTATLALTCYYALAWVQEDKPRYLIGTAAGTFLSTLARYDGWSLFLALLVLVAIVGLMKKYAWSRIVGNLLIFSVLGGFGIGLWLLWNQAIFGDFLYFQRGPFSAQFQDVGFLQAHILYTNHNLWQSLRYYCIDSAETIGPILFVLIAIGVVVLVLRKRFTPEMLAGLIFLVPFGFYVVSLYGGQASLFLPGAVPSNAPYQFFNVRYGAQMVVPAAIFLATLIGGWRLPSLRRFWCRAAHLVILIVIAAQSILIASGGIISLQDGQYGLSCDIPHPINVYLAQHYAGGKILEDTFTAKIYGGDAGVDFKDFIYEGSGPIWNAALQQPAQIVNWVVVNMKSPDDLVLTHINVQSPEFLSQFRLVVQEATGDNLYYRIGAGPLPTRPAPDGLLTTYRLCKPH